MMPLHDVRIGSMKRRTILKRAARLIRPRPRCTPDAWAAANRSYPASAGIPGPRDPGLTAYAVPWARALASGRYRRVVLICATQMGKTDSMLDVIGERLDNRPAPILYVGPSKEFCTDQFEPRLMALLDEAPTLADRVARGKRNKKTKKTIAGVSVRLAHAGSATALKSDPAALALVDEYDGMLADVQGDGGVLGLVEGRGFTYADFSVGIASTPSLGTVDVGLDEESGLSFWKLGAVEDIESPIWRLFQEGTRHHWAWPCPHCAEYFIPRASCLKWDTPEHGHATPAGARRSAYLECPSCGGVITDQDKPDLNARGRMVAPGQVFSQDGAISGDAPDSSTASFWVSGLCSPFVTFGERAEKYVSAVRLGDFKGLQSAINTNFGECYAPGGGEAPEWAEVAEHRGVYARGELPDGVLFPVMTVDVQKNRLFYVIRGWGARAESWLLDYGTLWGETTEESIWTDLADLIKTPVGDMSLRLVLIDSGFRPGKKIELPLIRIFDFCRRFPRFVRPTKGSSQAMRVPIIKSKIEVTRHGAAAKWSLELIRLDTDHFKSWVHERVRWPDDQPGAWHLTSDASDDYCKQIIAEARMRLTSGKVRWVERSKENHYLDCEAMQAAAAHLLNVARIGAGVVRPTRHPVKVPRPDDAETAESSAEPRRPQHGLRPSGWMNPNGSGPRNSWFDRR
jgi:phage terminase large subunit GpA-like protein